MLFPTVFSVLALAVSSVNAHGYIKELIADGKTYKGPVAGGAKISSPIRQISTTSPYKDVNGPGMTCGRDAKTASVIAPVTAGSTIKMSWEDHPGDTWNHDLGPLITYMTKVPEGQTADKFNPSNAQWFKIEQAGIESNGKWAQAKLMSGAFHSVTIPKNIPSGQYIMRHEIVALHLADKRGGVEFYGNCIQFNVKGGTGSANFLDGVATAKFPGGYKLDDKGIHVNVFNKGFKYTFPGPALFSSKSGASVKASVNSNSTTSDDDDDETTTSSTSKPKATNKSNSKDKSNHNGRSWASRMHKRYLGAVAAPAPAAAVSSE